MLLQGAAVAGEHRLRDRFEEDPLGLRDRVALEEEDASRLTLPGAPGAAGEKLRELLAGRFAVGARLLVQDHDVGPEPLETPMLVGAQDLPHEWQRIRSLDADEDDREIARDGESPETALPERVPGQRLSGGPQRGVGEEDP